MQALSETDLPSALPGFSHINRFWDKVHGLPTAKILPGEYYVTLKNELVATVLGSCVSACIRDKKLGVGGMNHFMLPFSSEGKNWSIENGPASAATRYGNFAMEHMINDILKNGGRKKNLEAKIFGGARILEKLSDVGAQNILFVRNYLDTEGIPVASEDLGEIFPRKVMYFPKTGKVLIKRIKHLHNDTVVRRETAYRDQIEHQPVSSSVELF